MAGAEQAIQSGADGVDPSSPRERLDFLVLSTMVGVAYDLGGQELAEQVVTAGTTETGFSPLAAGQLLESTEEGLMGVVMARLAARGDQMNVEEPLQGDPLGIHRLGATMLMGFPGPGGTEVETSWNY